MATREKGRKKTKQEAPQETSQQFTITDPISMADLENIHTRRRKYPSHPPPFGPKTLGFGPKGKGGKSAQRKKGKTPEHAIGGLLPLMPAFQDYTSEMMSALNNPWKPRSKKTATPTWSAVPPLVYVSAAGTPVNDTRSKQEIDEKYVPVNLSAVDKTVLTPQGRQETEGIASPVNFTKDLAEWKCIKSESAGRCFDGSIRVWPRQSGGKGSRFLYA